MEKLRRKIRMFAFHTRLFILILQFVCNWVIPDHEVIGVEDAVMETFLQADAFQWPIDPAWVPTIADKLVGFLLDGLIRSAAPLTIQRHPHILLSHIHSHIQCHIQSHNTFTELKEFQF